MVKITQEIFEKRIYDLVGDEYTVIGKYIKTNKPVEIKHNICNTVHKYRPNNFYHGSRCSYCRIKNQTKTNEWFLSKLKKSKGKDFVPLTEYKSSREKIKMKHTVCGYIWDVTPDNLLRRKSGCPKCNKNARLNTDEYKKVFKSIVGEEYEVIGTYKNARTKIKYRHKTCGTEWETVPYSIKQGSRCPYCKSSKGERYIISVLNKNNINFETEKTFDKCKYKNLLRFDFYLEEFNLCIEYDGIQHFEPTDFGNRGKNYSIEFFNEVTLKDNIKNKFCEKNNINLLRIPYTLDFELIEKEIIEKIKLIKSKAENLTPKS